MIHEDQMQFWVACRGDLLAATLRPFAVQPGVFVEEGAVATTITIHRSPELDFEVTVVPDVLEMFLVARDPRTGEEIARDRAEYYETEGESPEELRDQLLADLRRLLEVATKCPVRTAERLVPRLLPWRKPRRQAYVEAARGSTWQQIVPFSEDFPWQTP